jgi:CHAD domain-containing protein
VVISCSPERRSPTATVGRPGEGAKRLRRDDHGSPVAIARAAAAVGATIPIRRRLAGKRVGMGYRFEVDETVDDGFHRITEEQVGAALAALEGVGGPGGDEAVHDSRKRGKKLRGLLRLVRPVLGDAYGPANAAFRDAGRELSALRDADAALASFDDLVAASSDLLPEGGLGAVRAGLAADAERAAGRDRRARAEAAAELSRAGGRRVARAGLDVSGWPALAPGLARTYRRGRRALADVRRDPHPERVHEWRKRAKDGWYHVRLLEHAAPSVLRPLDDAFHALSDALGDAHDLVVVAERLRADPDRYGGPDQVPAAVDLSNRRRRALEGRAVRLGARLYAEKPPIFAARLGGFWQAWHDVGDEKPTGSLADLYPPADDLDDLDMETLRDRAGVAGLPGRPYPTRSDLVGELRAAGAG